MSEVDCEHREPGLFALHEYADATSKFFADAVHALARAEDGLLARIHVEDVEALPPSRNTLPSGEILESPRSEATTALVFSVAEGIAGNFDEVHVAIAQAARDYSAQVVPHILQQISDMCDATGNVVNRAGRSVWDAQLEMLETIAISFDADGTPTLPSMVMHPDMAATLGDPPPGFAAKFDDVISRRRDEWMARRRTRRLPRDGH